MVHSRQFTSSMSATDQARLFSSLIHGKLHTFLSNLQNESHSHGHFVQKKNSARMVTTCAFTGRKTLKNKKHAALPPLDHVEALVSALSAEDNNHFAALAFHSKYMETSDWFKLFENLGKRENWLLILEIFRWMQQQRWYRPDDGFYSKIISILGKTNQLNRAVWLFKEMKKQGCRPDTSVFNSLINAHIRNSSNKEVALVKALKYFEYMKTTRHCKPNLVTYNTLLRACAQAKEHKKLEELFEEMCQEGIKPDIFTFNGIIDAHGKAGEFSAMVSMFRKMRKCKIKPDYMTYNSMIDAYGKAGLITEMEEALEDMATSKVKPQLSTLNSLINNYGAAKRVDLMELVVQNMSALGIHPSLITYEVLIKGYGNSGCFEKLRTCLEAMIDAGVMPETTTLNAVMEVYSNNGLFKEAENLLDNVAVMPTELTYLILYRGYLKHGRVDKIDALIERMNAAGIVPNDKFLMHSLEFATLDPKSRTSRDVAKDSSNNAERVSMHLENSRTIPKSA